MGDDGDRGEGNGALLDVRVPVPVGNLNSPEYVGVAGSSALIWSMLGRVVLTAKNARTMNKISSEYDRSIL